VNWLKFYEIRIRFTRDTISRILRLPSPLISPFELYSSANTKFTRDTISRIFNSPSSFISPSRVSSKASRGYLCARAMFA